MKFFVIRKDYHLKAGWDDDLKKLKKLKKGEIYQISIKLYRNINFHRKFFALLNIGFENTRSEITDFEDYRAYAIMKSGFVKEVKTDRGVFHMPKSISFDNMDEAEFELLFKALLNFVIIDIRADEETIMNELINFM